MKGSTTREWTTFLSAKLSFTHSDFRGVDQSRTDRFRRFRIKYVVYMLSFSLSVVRSTHLVREVKIGLGIANSHNNGKVSILASNV